MITLLLIALGAIFNSIQDTLYSHFSTSIFRKLDPKFWKALDSWAYAKRFVGYPIDAWHISKTLFLTNILLSIVFYKPILGQIYDFLLFGLTYNVIFNIFYLYFLRKPNKS